MVAPSRDFQLTMRAPILDIHPSNLLTYASLAAALGEELLVLFLYMIATTIWAVPRLLRTRTALYGRRNLWFRVALLTAGTAATLSGGLALAAGAAWALQLLAASVLILIFVSVFRTWDIVFRAARATDR